MLFNCSGGLKLFVLEGLFQMFIVSATFWLGSTSCTWSGGLTYPTNIYWFLTVFKYLSLSLGVQQRLRQMKYSRQNAQTMKTETDKWKIQINHSKLMSKQLSRCLSGWMEGRMDEYKDYILIDTDRWWWSG